MADLAARQHGVVARRQLLALGLTQNMISHRLRSGALHRIRPGVYAVGHGRLSLRGRWSADVLACGPEAVLGGETAAMLWSLRPVNRRRTTVITPARGRRKPKGIDLRTTRRLEPHEATVRDGIPTTSLPRTLEDCATTLDDEQLESVLEHAFVEHRLDPGEVPRRDPRLTRLLDDLQTGQALTRSDLEALFRAILKRASLPLPKANASVWTGERHYQPDFLWPQHRLIVEIDGWTTHRARTEADRRREAHLHALGYRIQRFTRLQLLRRPDEVIAALRAVLTA